MSWSLVEGVLPTVVYRCVWSRNLKSQEALARVGLQPPQEKNGLYNFRDHEKCLTELETIKWLRAQKRKE